MAGLLIEKVPLGYKKISGIARDYTRIISLATNKKMLDRLPTKDSPKTSSTQLIKINFPKKALNAKQITIDDIDSFSKIKDISNPPKAKRISETKMKFGIGKILGETSIK